MMRKKTALLCALCALSLSLGFHKFSNPQIVKEVHPDDPKLAASQPLATNRVVVETPDPITISTKDVNEIRKLLPTQVNVRVVSFQNGQPITTRATAQVTWNTFTSDQITEDFVLSGKVTYGGSQYDASLLLTYEEGVRAFAKDFYVEKGSAYDLPSSVKVLYTDGSYEDSSSVQWTGNKPSSATVGEYTIKGKANGSLDVTLKVIVHEKSNPDGTNIASTGTFAFNWDYSNDAKNDPKKLVNNQLYGEDGVDNWAAQQGSKPRQSEYTVDLKWTTPQSGLNKVVTYWYFNDPINMEIPTSITLSYKAQSSATAWTNVAIQPTVNKDSDSASHTFSLATQITAQEVRITFKNDSPANGPGNNKYPFSTLTEFQVYSTSTFVPEQKSSDPSIDGILYLRGSPVEVPNFIANLHSYSLTLTDGEIGSLDIRRNFLSGAADERNKSYSVLIPGVVGGKPYKLVNISEDLENYVVYDIFVNTVKYGVTVVGDAIASVPTAAKGETVTITVKDPTKDFESVTVTGTTATKVSDKEYTFVMPGKDVTVTATLKENTPAPVEHQITVIGEATVSKSSALPGEVITIKIKQQGKIFKSIIIDPKPDKGDFIKINDSEYTFVMTDQDTKVTVVVVDAPAVAHKITVNGDATASASTAIKGTKVTITVKDPNKIFDTVTGVEGLVKDSDTQYSFTMPDSDVTIKVTVKEKPPVTYSITVVGEATVDKTTAVAGDTVTVKVKEQGKVFDSVTVTGVPNPDKVSDTVYTFVMPSQNVTVTVKVKTPDPVTHKITVEGEARADKQTAKEGETVVITATGTNKIIESISGVASFEKISDTQYTFVMPDNDVTIKVVVKDAPPVSHTITVVGEAIASASTALPGETVTVRVKEEGKIFDSVTGVDGLTKVNDTEYTFVMPDRDVTVTVTVKDTSVIGHKVKISGVDGSAVTSSVDSAAPGETVTITVKEEGKIIDTISGVEGLVKISDTQYSFRMPDSDVTITITLKDAPNTNNNTQVQQTPVSIGLIIGIVMGVILVVVTIIGGAYLLFRFMVRKK